MSLKLNTECPTHCGSQFFVCLLPSSSSEAEGAVLKVSPEPWGMQVSRLLPVCEFCFSYQQMLAVPKQAAEVAVSDWAGVGSCWVSKGLWVGRFKGTEEFYHFGGL